VEGANRGRFSLAESLRADWASPAQLKADFSHASILRDGRVVFNIAGNKYRLVVWINYPYRVVYIRFIGTHAQYDNGPARVDRERTGAHDRPLQSCV
jgi:mRNA-degrading endonuclease HigB of HigAB toxin-antitoxin module